MSYNKLGFTSGQTLKADHLNYMESGIEAIANNVQIKKIVFTDRPSIYNWLLENYKKVIYINVITSICPWYVKFIPHYYYIGDDVGFGLVQINSFGDKTLVPSSIQITDSSVTYTVDETINIEQDGTVVGEHVVSQTVPDEYWSSLNIECTAYYFDEH